MERCCLHSSVIGCDSSESLMANDQPKGASSKLWWAGLSPSPSLGMTSPPVSSSSLEGRLPWGSPPASCWCLPAKKGSKRNGEAGWSASWVLYSPRKCELQIMLWGISRYPVGQGLWGIDWRPGGKKWDRWEGWSRSAHPSHLKDGQNSA